MAHSDRIQQLQQEIKYIQEELLPLSRGAVFIKDPKKRRKCPLCSQNLYLYNINYEEMFLMCENSSCDFPFGYEAIQIVQDESELRENPVKASRDFFEYPTTNVVDLPATIDSILGTGTCTMSTMSYLSDCDRMSQLSDPEDLTLDKQEILAARLPRGDTKKKKKMLQNQEVQNSLDRIKQLTEEMNELVQGKHTNSKVIKNKKWLQTLKKWEGSSGLKLLNDSENNQLSKPDTEMVKISLEPVTNGNTAVNINIVMDTCKHDINITENVYKNSAEVINVEESTKNNQNEEISSQQVSSIETEKKETNSVSFDEEKDKNTNISCTKSSENKETSCPKNIVNCEKIVQKKCHSKTDCKEVVINGINNIYQEDNNIKSEVGDTEKSKD